MTMKLQNEPLLHFLIFGTALFAVCAWLDNGKRDAQAAGTKQVRITESDVHWLEEAWTRQWQRHPTREELRGLVTGYLREELLAREARELGLDQNDTFIRRWLAQKVQFLVQDTARPIEPTEDDLQKFYAAHPEQFVEEARVSFLQVYFSQDHPEEIAAALSRLRTSDNPTVIGERLLVPSEFHDAGHQAVAGQLGEEFARSVFVLQPGKWHGPIVSGYGLHLVRVSTLKPARQRAFAEVKDKVLEAWRQKQQQAEREKYYAELEKKYEVAADESVKPLLGPMAEVAR